MTEAIKPQSCGKTETGPAIILGQSGGQIAAALLGCDFAVAETAVLADLAKDRLPTPPLPEGIPDRLCIEGDSPYHSAATPYIGVKINGSTEDSGDVVEYCVSKRWVRLGVRPEPGKPIKRVPGSMYKLETTRLDDVAVEVYWRTQPSRQVRRALARGK